MKNKDKTGNVFLIPTVLQDDANALAALPSDIKDTVAQCEVFFVENERTARRHLKKIWKEIIIDNYEWHTIGKAEKEVVQIFVQILQSGKNIGIISEAGCPGIADPGQFLIAAAQKCNAYVHPLVGPSSILLALMASGMNGQYFQFVGYLPIENHLRRARLLELEAESKKKNCTQIFIETPYRNQQLVKDIISACHKNTRLCVAVDITAGTESITTKKVAEWAAMDNASLHKRPAIFLIDAGEEGYQP